MISRSDVLKGFVTLDGAKISKAEIQLHLPTWNKGHPLPVHLDPDQPTELPQISTCSLLLELVIQCLYRAKDEPQVKVLIAEIEDAIRYCKQAVSALENSDNTFSMVPARMIGSPDDLLISFGVQNACIVAAAYASIPIVTTAPILSGNSIRGGASRSSLAGHHLGGNAHELLVRVDSVVPALIATRKMLFHCISKLSTMVVLLTNSSKDLNYSTSNPHNNLKV